MDTATATATATATVIGTAEVERITVVTDTPKPKRIGLFNPTHYVETMANHATWMTADMAREFAGVFADYRNCYREMQKLNVEIDELRRLVSEVTEAMRERTLSDTEYKELVFKLETYTVSLAYRERRHYGKFGSRLRELENTLWNWYDGEYRDFDCNEYQKTKK